MSTIDSLLQRMPKVELHCHLDGNLRARTVAELAEAQGVTLPTTDPEALLEHLRVSPDCASLPEFLSKFPIPISVMQTKEALYRVAFELLKDMASQNVKYMEIRWAPFFHIGEHLSFAEAVESILSAMEQAKKIFGIHSNLILICMRHHPPERSVQVVELGKAYLGRGVVAVDLAGNEVDFPPELHREAFDLAKAYGYRITVHAGETGVAKHIVTAVEQLHAERIGHGIAAYRDPEVHRFVRERRIPLEICIVANVQIQAETYESHPIRRYFDEGIPVTVNTDAMTVSDTSLARIYRTLMDVQGFAVSEIKEMILQAARASFLPQDDKDGLLADLHWEFSKLGL